jgi:hypothetical protein
MFDGSPEVEHISCKRYRGDGDSAVRVKRTDQYRQRRERGFEPKEWREGDDVDVQSDWHASER